MKVLKKIRRKKQGTMRIGIGSKKHLNYSTVSNGSGNTEDDDSMDLIESLSPLNPEDIKRVSVPETTPEPKLSLFHDNSKPLVVPKVQEKKKNPIVEKPSRPILLEVAPMSSEAEPNKRVPADPIAPLGTVVNDENENEWDSISHISGISNHTSSSAKSPIGINLSSNDVQEEVNEMKAEAAEATEPPQSSSVPSTEDATDRPPAVVSPGPEDKAVGTVSSEEEDGALVRRMFKQFDDNDSNSKISHIFEDDQESHQNNSNNSSKNNQNLIVVHNVATSPIYAEKIPMPATVTPAKVSPERSPARVVEEEQMPIGEDLVPAFEAVITEKIAQRVGDYKTPPKQRRLEKNPCPPVELAESPHPDLRGAIAPSFDGSTATEFTNNTTSNKSGSNSSNRVARIPTEKTDDDTKNENESVFSNKIHEKLSAIEVSVRSSCASMGDLKMKKPEMPEFNPPNCDSVFSSTQALSANLRDSLQTIRTELSGAVSGLSSASSAVVKMAQQESRAFFQKDENDKLNTSDDVHIHSQYLEEESDYTDDLHIIPEESCASSSQTSNMLNSSNGTGRTAESVCPSSGGLYQRTSTQASF